MEWTVEFYRNSDGEEPVAEFFDALPIDIRAKITRLLDLLSNYGVLLKEPHTKQIRGKIREIRIKDNIGAVRILYFGYTGRRFVLLHGFVKKSDKTPQREIDTAELRMQDFLKRHGGVK